MACLADVFTEEEKINWLKAWLAIDISKSGLEQFVENEAKTLHANIYNNVWSSTTSPAVCIGCHTANLLKCPTPGICNRHGRNNTCTSMHDTASKQPRPCHVNLCNKVFDEISKNHKYRSPSWKNTTAKNWASNAWQIAKAYLPPDGYAEKNSIQETDFNGVVSFMINCKQFDSKFSFAISPGKPNPPCLLTKARDIGRKVRHSSQCKVTDADLQDIFTTLTSLLTDPTCLAQDVAAQEAVKKLAELLNDVLKITTAEMIHLLEAAQDTLNNVENVAAKTLNKIRVYIEHYKELTDKCKQELNEHTAKCKDALNEHGQRTAESKYEQACEEMTRCMVKLYTRTLSHVTTSPLNECVQVRLGQIFMPPNIQLMKENKGFFKKTGEQITRYKDVFIKDGQLNRRIFIQGEAGTGKSTFLAKLVLDWCRTTTVEQFPNNECTISGSSTFFADLNILKDYTFVFRVTLRDSVIKFDIYTMIKEQIVDSLYSSEEDREKAYTSLNEIMKRELCLILLDGLDEWTGLGDKHNLPTLVENHSHCVLLITTRPWKLVEERIKHSEMDILLQLEGIHDPLKMSRMFLSCLVNREELNKKHSAFLRYIREQKLDELLSSPMMLSVIVCFYAEGTELKGSLCEIYSLLLDSLLKKASSQKKYFQQPPFTCLKETQYIKPNIDNVNQIAKVAFCLLFSETKENSIVFGVKELEALVEDGHRKFALKAGILTETKTLCVVRSTSTFSFIHKSVQEFLAAYHIACNEHVINDVISGYRKRLDKSTSDISHVYIFLCGLSIPAANALSSLINDMPRTSHWLDIQRL